MEGKIQMQSKEDSRSLRERVSIMLGPVDPPELVRSLVGIEEAGVDHVWIGFGPAWSPDLLTTLAAAVARTTRLKVGTSIVQVSSRHPVLIAQQALSISRLAPGRLSLGIGTGSAALAKSVYGVELNAPLAYLREYVQVLRALLQQGEVHHQGRYFTVDVSMQAASQVPLLISALGPAAFRLAGEVADGVLPFMCPMPYLTTTALSALNEGAAAVGRTRPPIVAHVPVVFTEERAIALEVGRQAMGFYAKLPTYSNMFKAAGFAEQEIMAVSDRLVESLLVFGDESSIKGRLQELLASGVDELTLTLTPISDATQERTRLAQLVGQL
jgi:F420-dependent oxidoreductase-like protein